MSFTGVPLAIGTQLNRTVKCNFSTNQPQGRSPETLALEPHIPSKSLGKPRVRKLFLKTAASVPELRKLDLELLKLVGTTRKREGLCSNNQGVSIIN